MQNVSLTPDLLRLAYSQGYFPMPHPRTGEIHWFCPDPRAVLPLNGFHVSRSLARSRRRGHLTCTRDRAFEAVMHACADRKETWITDEFIAAYTALHREGNAHSVEVWHDGQLAGGVYGVVLGGAFFAESMFHRVTDASKIALWYLCEHLSARGFSLLEVQFVTPHLASLGAVEIPRADYFKLLKQALALKVTWD